MVKRPSFQFYPSDWMSDLKLRRCSAAARGVWVDVLCALHDSDDGYGIVKWPLKELANAVGASSPHLRELVDKGVLRGSDAGQVAPLVYTPRSGRKAGPAITLIDTQAGPLWYSKRLVIDDYVRTTRANSGTFGAAPDDTPKAAPKPPKGEHEGDGSSISSSASHKRLPPTPKGVATDPPGFVRFWETWPSNDRKGGRSKCMEVWRRLKIEPDAERVVAHVEAMKATAKWRENGGEFVPMPSTYLNGRRWDGADTADAGTLAFEGAI